MKAFLAGNRSKALGWMRGKLSGGSAGAGGAEGEEAAAAAKVHICIGNEACDADSIVSALTHSYLCHTKSERLGDGWVHFPVISCRRDEFAMRCETVWLLNATDINVDDCLFVDDIDLADVASKVTAAGGDSDDSFRVTLVDHNALTPSLAPLDPFVVEIVDHHKDTGKYPTVFGDARMISFDATANRGVGSTCTLVAQKCLETGACDALLARMLLAVILLDTSNLNPDMGKVTPADKEVAERLRAMLGWSEEEAMDKLSEPMLAAKFNPEFWGSLSLAQALTYDYKGFSAPTGGKFGISSVLHHIPDFLARDDKHVVTMTEFAKEHDLEALLMMSLVLGADDSVRREVVVFGPGVASGTPSPTFDTIKAVVEGNTTLDTTEALDLGTSPYTRSFLCGWQQGNIKASRKQLVPLIMAAFDGSK